MMEPKIEKQLVLKFSLPGVDFEGMSTTSRSHLHDLSQLENPRRDQENWTLRVNERNLATTAERFREIAATLDRFAGELAR